MEQVQSEHNSKKWMAPFFTIWGGQAVSLLGSQLVQFALIWWLTQTTGSGTVLATATLAGMLPQVFLGPLVGALVDRWSRRLVMMIADSLVALATLGLAVLFWAGSVQIWHVYLLMFLRGVGGVFHWAAFQASTSLMVPKEHLSRVQGLNQMLNGAMNIGSAPLGALLLAYLPMQGILGIDIGTAMVAVLPLFFIAVPQPAVPQPAVPQPDLNASQQAPDGKPSLWDDLRAGLRYVWAWPGLMMILVMATLINLLLTPASSLQPLLVRNHFGGQAIQLAWMEAVWGIGVVAGGLTLSAWGGFRRRVFTSLLGLLILGAGMSLIGALPASGFRLAVGLMFVVGFTNPIINGPLFAVIQSVVAPEMQGRVFTLVISAASAMTPLGLLVAGPAADIFGVRSWFVVGGILTALLGMGALFVPAIMNIEEDRRSASGQDVEDLPLEKRAAFSPSAPAD